jgi:hypothetical protein
VTLFVCGGKHKPRGTWNIKLIYLDENPRAHFTELYDMNYGRFGHALVRFENWAYAFAGACPENMVEVDENERYNLDTEDGWTDDIPMMPQRDTGGDSHAVVY